MKLSIWTILTGLCSELMLTNTEARIVDMSYEKLFTVSIYRNYSKIKISGNFFLVYDHWYQIVELKIYKNTVTLTSLRTS